MIQSAFLCAYLTLYWPLMQSRGAIEGIRDTLGGATGAVSQKAKLLGAHALSVAKASWSRLTAGSPAPADDIDDQHIVSFSLSSDVLCGGCKALCIALLHCHDIASNNPVQRSLKWRARKSGLTESLVVMQARHRPLSPEASEASSAAASLPDLDLASDRASIGAVPRSYSDEAAVESPAAPDLSMHAEVHILALHI